MIYLQWISYDGNGRKPPNTIKRINEIKEKFSPFGCPPILPHVNEMEADCFPEFEDTENKSDLP